MQPGCIFVCFPGERVDGHDYAAKAYQAGAEYVIANHPVEGVPEDHLVICESSYLAMIRMASNYRTLFSPLMIGVTGSVGKTTTKEFCYAVLSAFGNTLKTEGNQNNEIGLPNTLFRLEDTTQYAVVEMGMSHLGEIARRTYLEVELFTGKSHQIRAHLAALGHPLIGDGKYGDKHINDRFRRQGIRSQMLHAYRIEFPEMDGLFAGLSGRVFTALEPESFLLLKKNGN